MYISEISPARVRGRMTGLFQFNVIFGILMAYISNYLLRETGSEPWRFMLGIEGIPALLFFFLLFLVPRSPRFLIKINKVDEARKVFDFQFKTLDYGVMAHRNGKEWFQQLLDELE